MILERYQWLIHRTANTQRIVGYNATGGGYIGRSRLPINASNIEERNTVKTVIGHSELLTASLYKL
jgi:hypothetical protein